jgi:hypothetical protein
MLSTVAALAAVVIAAQSKPAFAGQDKCEEARAAGLSAVHARFDGAIGDYDKLIQELKAKNGNPDDVAIKINGNFMPLPAIRAKMENDRGTLLAAANEQADGCNAGLEPYQQAADALLATVTGGVEKLLPGKMGHVDVSQIMAGYPLGGPDALIPHLRTQIFDSLNMGPSNDLRKIIENPLGGPNSFFHKPFG